MLVGKVCVVGEKYQKATVIRLNITFILVVNEVLNVHKLFSLIWDCCLLKCSRWLFSDITFRKFFVEVSESFSFKNFLVDPNKKERGFDPKTSIFCTPQRSDFLTLLLLPENLAQ